MKAAKSLNMKYTVFEVLSNISNNSKIFQLSSQEKKRLDKIKRANKRAKKNSFVLGGSINQIL